jgi:hypothetical protein
MRAGIAYLLASRRRAAEAEGCWLALVLLVCLSSRLRTWANLIIAGARSVLLGLPNGGIIGIGCAKVFSTAMDTISRAR